MTLTNNKAIVRRVLDEILNGGNLASIDELVAQDFVDNASGTNGREAYKQSILQVRAAFPDMTRRIEDLIAEGDKVVARLTMEGTHKGEFLGIAPTGRRVAFTGIGIIRIANGQMVERWNNTDIFSLMQQIRAGNAHGG